MPTKEVRPEHYFSVCTGSLIKDIKELVFALDYLSDGEFNYHVNDRKNDFSAWVRDVFGEKELADELEKLKNKKDIQITLLKHLIKG